MAPAKYPLGRDLAVPVLLKNIFIRRLVIGSQWENP